MAQYGFFPQPGTDYTRGQEPEIARRLNQLARALHLHLLGVSGYRTPQHSVQVGGFADDPHTQGKASDTPGVEQVPESTLERFGLTRPFGGASEADHIQLKRGSSSPTRSGKNYTLGELWIQAGGSRNLAPIMQAIALAESGGKEDAVGGPNSDGTYDYGLWQINSTHSQFSRSRLLSDPLYNAKAAVSIERSQGLTAWTTYSSGAYKSHMGDNSGSFPTFGRTRPGGDTQDSEAGIGTAFASYITEGTTASGTPGTENVGLFGFPIGPNIPFLPDFNPLDVFKNAEGAVTDTLGFLKWIAWIFHPRNILRVVEFITGLTLMGAGLHTAIEAHRNQGGSSTLGRASREAIAATPVGRTLRVARGARAGRTAARTESRRAEYNRARKSARTKGTQQGKTRRNERVMRQRYGDDPPF